MGIFMLLGGFFLIFETVIPAAICLVGILGSLVYQSFVQDHGYHTLLLKLLKMKLALEARIKEREAVGHES